METATGRYLDAINDRAWELREAADSDQREQVTAGKSRKLLCDWYSGPPGSQSIYLLWLEAVAELGATSSEAVVLPRLLMAREEFDGLMQESLQRLYKPAEIFQRASQRIPRIGGASNDVLAVLPIVEARLTPAPLETSAPDPTVDSTSSPAETEIPLEARALALLVSRPDITTKTEIARLVGCSRQHLYELESFVAAWKAREAAGRRTSRRNIPRGSKDGKTGFVEAWRDVSCGGDEEI